MADFLRLEMVSVVVSVEFLVAESGPPDRPTAERRNMLVERALLP